MKTVRMTDAEVVASLREHGWVAAADRIDRLNGLLADYEEVNEDKKRLVREIDVILNGEDGAAKQASLCDIVAQLRTFKKEIALIKKQSRLLGLCSEYMRLTFPTSSTEANEIYCEIEKQMEAER